MENIKIEEGVIVIPQPSIPQPDERIKVKELIERIAEVEGYLAASVDTKAKAIIVHDKRIADTQKKLDELLAIKEEVLKLDPKALDIKVEEPLPVEDVRM